MKVWALAGMFTVAAVPFAGAADASAECQVTEDSRRAPVVRFDSNAFIAGGGAAPQVEQPSIVRDTREGETPERARETPEQTAARREAAAAARAAAERRRNVMQIPDAELIAPRRTL